MRINLEPKIWGPKAWFFLESCVIGYPDRPTHDEKIKFKTLFHSIKDILPCSKCRINYNDHLNKYPLTDKILNNKDELLSWIINIHNISSGRQYNIKDTINFYKNIYSSKNINNKLIISFVIFLLVLSLILYYYRYYR